MGSDETMTPSAGGLAPGGTRTMSPTSNRSVDIFSTFEFEDSEGEDFSFSLLPSSEELDDKVSETIRRASELRRFPRRVTALAA